MVCDNVFADIIQMQKKKAFDESLSSNDIQSTIRDLR